MIAKMRKIEIDEDTADRLEARAAARGISVSELIAELSGRDTGNARPRGHAQGRQRALGPDILAENARRIEDFQRSGEAIPWDEVRAWMQSWGTPDELPPPKPRKL